MKIKIKVSEKAGGDGLYSIKITGRVGRGKAAEIEEVILYALGGGSFRWLHDEVLQLRNKQDEISS
jgi:hypothetical protein